MKPDYVALIAWKHFSGSDCTREVHRAIDAILEAVELQKQTDAAICKQLQVESRKRVELGFTCAKAIEEQDNG